MKAKIGDNVLHKARDGKTYAWVNGIVSYSGTKVLLLNDHTWIYETDVLEVYSPKKAKKPKVKEVKADEALLAAFKVLLK